MTCNLSFSELTSHTKGGDEMNKNELKHILENNFLDILQKIFNDYELIMNTNQYVLIGSTIKSYLSYLKDGNKINYEFKENKMLWKQTAENNII